MGGHQRQGLRSHPVLQRASRWTHCAAQQSRKKCLACLRAGQPLQKREGKCDAQVPDRQFGPQLSDGTVAEGRGVNCTQHLLDCGSGDTHPGGHLLLGSMSRATYACIFLFITIIFINLLE